jgi:hypothetical protein
MQVISALFATKRMLGLNFLWLKQLNSYTLLSHYAKMGYCYFSKGIDRVVKKAPMLSDSTQLQTPRVIQSSQ